MSNILEDIQSAVIKEAAQSGIADSLALIRAQLGIEKIARWWSLWSLALCVICAAIWGDTNRVWEGSAGWHTGITWAAIFSCAAFFAGAPLVLADAAMDVEQGEVDHYALLRARARPFTDAYTSKKWDVLVRRWLPAGGLAWAGGMLLVGAVGQVVGAVPFVALPIAGVAVITKRIRTLKKRERALLNHVNIMT